MCVFRVSSPTSLKPSAPLLPNTSGKGNFNGEVASRAYRFPRVTSRCFRFLIYRRDSNTKEEKETCSKLKVYPSTGSVLAGLARPGITPARSDRWHHCPLLRKSRGHYYLRGLFRLVNTTLAKTTKEI